MGKSKVKTASKSGLVRTQYERRKWQPNEYKPKVAEVMYGKGITGFWRLYEIHRLISQGQHPNCSYLAEHFEVHRRTVERDIERLRDLFGAPIQYDRNKKGYCYTALLTSSCKAQGRRGDRLVSGSEAFGTVQGYAFGGVCGKRHA